MAIALTDIVDDYYTNFANIRLREASEASEDREDQKSINKKYQQDAWVQWP